MKKRILSVLLCLCMALALMSVTALAALTATNIQVTDATYYDSGAVKSVTTTFGWNQAGVTGRLVLMTERLRSKGEAGTDSSYGDFTNFGYYADNYNFATFDDVVKHDTDNNNVFGIISYTEEQDISSGTDNNEMSISFDETAIPLNKDATYYVYFWTKYQEEYYPDNLILAFTVKNGGLKYAVATDAADRNTLSDTYTEVVSETKYSVTVTAGGNMTKTAESGAESQSELTTAMTPVVYTANEGYYFPENYAVSTVNGIMVRRDSDTQITVYGTPSGNAEITLTAASPIPTYTVTVQSDNNGTASATPSSAAANTKITLSAQANTGYKFKEWQVISGGVTITNNEFTLLSSDVTVKAIFEAETYTVTLHTNDGTIANGKNVTGYTYGVGAALPTAEDMTKTGCTFGGWFTNKECTGTAVTAISATDTGNKEYWAKWTEDQPSQPAELESVIFTHAYDVQRSPAFPTSAGSTITLSGLGKPLLDGGRGDVKSTNEGTWTLTKVGTYSYVKSLGETIDFVSTVASNYNVNANEVVIHQLKDGDDPIAYGVVIVYDTVNQYAVFIGNNIGGSGAGYLLTMGATTGPVTATATMIATDFIPTCKLALDTTGTYTFADTTAKTVTASNSGNAATGALTVALSGTNAESFELSKTAIADIAAGGTATFTVAPKTGLEAGTYTATVTVSGVNVVSQSFDVSFTVSAPAPVTYTVTYDANGHGTAPAAQTVNSGAAATEPAAPAATGYTFGGWYKEADCTNAWNFSTDTVTDDTTLYAKWTANTYTVTLNTNGGTVNSDDVTSYTYGVGAVLPTDVTRRGYFFKGWYDNVQCTGDPVTAISATETGDKTFYADWVRIYYPTADVHSCTDECDICGGCTDLDCTERACKDKCILLTMDFADVLPGQWYTEGVRYVYHHGMMEGPGNGLFDIEGTTSRAMIVTILWRLEGCPVVNYLMQFEDVPADSWYTEAVRWAAAEGIVVGYNGEFFPDDPITREQLAAILWRYAVYKDIDVSVGENTNILSYRDAFDVSEYAISAMQWACGEGIIAGKDGALDPQGCAMRSEAATMLMRFCEALLNG